MADLQSPNFIKLVIDGERNLTVNTIFKLASAMRLKPYEHEFFEALVHFTQEEDQSVRDYYKLKMNKIRPEFSSKQVPTTQIDTDVKFAMEDPMWEAFALFVEGRTVQDVQNILKEKRTRNAPAIEKGVLRGLRDGYLRLENGIYKSNFYGSRILDQWHSEDSIKKHFLNQINETLQAFDTLYKRMTSQFSTLTFAVKDANQLYSIKKRLAEMIRREVETLPELPPSERLLISRVNLQIYSVIEIDSLSQP